MTPEGNRSRDATLYFYFACSKTKSWKEIFVFPEVIISDEFLKIHEGKIWISYHYLIFKLTQNYYLSPSEPIQDFKRAKQTQYVLSIHFDCQIVKSSLSDLREPLYVLIDKRILKVCMLSFTSKLFRTRISRAAYFYLHIKYESNV